MRWLDAIGAFGWGLLVIGVLICFSTAGNRSELFAWTVGGAMWVAGFVTIVMWLLARLMHQHTRRALPKYSKRV